MATRLLREIARKLSFTLRRILAISCVVIIIIIISGFGIYGAAVVPDSAVGNTWQRLTLVLHEFLSNGLTPSRLHIVISFLTHADHVFLGLPRSLVPGSPNRVMELMHEVARCTCPYHVPIKRFTAVTYQEEIWLADLDSVISPHRTTKSSTSHFYFYQSLLLTYLQQGRQKPSVLLTCLLT